MFRDCIERGGVENYAEKERGEVKLDLTTNPLEIPISPRDLVDEVTENDLRTYPEPPELSGLLEETAQVNGVNPENVMLTAGADQGIEIALTHLLDPGDSIGIKTPTFPRYRIVAERICDAETISGDRIEEVTSQSVVALCSPNNPSTGELERSQVVEILKENPDTVFVVDAVFAGYGSWNPAELVESHDNLIVLRSPSKELGAGLRIGSLISDADNIDRLRTGVSPFRVSPVIQKMALKLLDRREKRLEETVEFLEKEYSFVNSRIEDTKRETDVPFYLVRTERPSDQICRKLLDRGISVVNAGNFRGLQENWIRVAIGGRKQNRKFVEALQDIRTTDRDFSRSHQSSPP